MATSESQPATAGGLTHGQWYAALRRAATKAAAGTKRLTKAQVEKLDVPGAKDLFDSLGKNVVSVESFLSLAKASAPKSAGLGGTDFRIGLGELTKNTPTKPKPTSLTKLLAPLDAAAKKLTAAYAGWGLSGQAAPVSIRAFPDAKSAEDVRKGIEQGPGFGAGWSVSDSIFYGGIPQSPAGLWRATTLYLKYYLLQYQQRPMSEAKKVQEFEKTIEAALAKMEPKSMTAISTLFNRSSGGSTEWMSLAIETKDGRWFAINGPHHHPWGGHIHDVWTPPADVR